MNLKTIICFKVEVLETGRVNYFVQYCIGLVSSKKEVSLLPEAQTTPSLPHHRISWRSWAHMALNYTTVNPEHSTVSAKASQDQKGSKKQDDVTHQLWLSAEESRSLWAGVWPKSEAKGMARISARESNQTDSFSEMEEYFLKRQLSSPWAGPL